MSSYSDYIQFYKGLEKHVKKTFGELLESSAAEEQDVLAKLQNPSTWTDSDVVEPNLEIRLVYPKIFSERTWVKFAVLSWFVNPATQFELQEVLRKKGEQLKIRNFKSYLESKKLMVFTLFLEANFRSNDLFGNILQPGTMENYRDSEGKKKRVLRKDVLKLTLQRPKKAKKKVFRRGYNDHGSLPAADERARRLADEFAGTIEHRILELERNSWKLTIQNDLLSIEKLFEEVVRGII